MTLRRRIALFLDPDLTPAPSADPAPPALHLDLSAHHLADIANVLERLVKVADRIERRKRRPRIVECAHPELHEEAAA